MQIQLEVSQDKINVAIDKIAKTYIVNRILLKYFVS